jgi:hypothetical protein
MHTSFRRHVMPVFVVLGATVGLVLGGSSPVAAARIHPGNATLVLRSVAGTAGLAVGRTATCPTGDRAITGGAYWHRPGQNGDPTLPVQLSASSPTQDGTGWYAAGLSNASETLVLTVLAQCLPSNSFAAYVVLSHDLPVDPSRPGNANLRCPDGDRVVMGGGAWHLPGKANDPALDVQLTGTSPDIAGLYWSAMGMSFETRTVKFRVLAFCLPSTAFGAGWTTLGDTHQASEPAVYDQYIQCPSGLRALGGGIVWSYPGDPTGIPATESQAQLRSVGTNGNDLNLYIGVNAYNPRIHGNMNSTIVETCTDA